MYELDTNNIKALFVKEGLTYKDVGKVIGVESSLLAKKMTGKVRFNLNDVFGLIKLLDMKFEQIFVLKK